VGARRRLSPLRTPSTTAPGRPFRIRARGALAVVRGLFSSRPPVATVRHLTPYQECSGAPPARTVRHVPSPTSPARPPVRMEARMRALVAAVAGLAAACAPVAARAALGGGQGGPCPRPLLTAGPAHPGPPRPGGRPTCAARPAWSCSPSPGAPRHCPRGCAGTPSRTTDRDVVVRDGLTYVAGPDGETVSRITTAPIHYRGTRDFRGLEVYCFEQTIPLDASPLPQDPARGGHHPRGHRRHRHHPLLHHGPGSGSNPSPARPSTARRSTARNCAATSSAAGTR